ncbi:unnamed protein product [Pelagomonas calceolata]|uniref:Uncharacterized protein n=1 Tax=Pelagomonas calceolata TaxID=35677 RepID=A0A8J2SSS3_9STRA|nr:unnamed protein product [Pelagomonas calceolata]
MICSRCVSRRSNMSLRSRAFVHVARSPMNIVMALLSLTCSRFKASAAAARSRSRSLSFFRLAFSSSTIASLSVNVI